MKIKKLTEAKKLIERNKVYIEDDSFLNKY